MDGYNFLQDMLDTYQSFSEWMKLAWLVVPPLVFLGLLVIILRYRLAGRAFHQRETQVGELVYSIYRNNANDWQVYRHDALAGDDPALLIFEEEELLLERRQDREG